MSENVGVGLNFDDEKSEQKCEQKCEHKFVLLRSDKWKEEERYVSYYHRRDTFFCEKCLEYKEKKFDQYEGRNIPDWYRG